jgi:hypothetical protein
MRRVGIASSVGAGYQHDIYRRYAFLRHLVQAPTRYVNGAGSPICERLASSHPTNRPEVRLAAAEFRRWARRLSRPPIPFVEERAK